MNDLEFWNSKLSALAIALRNGWSFQWPANPPEWWTAKAQAMVAGNAK